MLAHQRLPLQQNIDPNPTINHDTTRYPNPDPTHQSSHPNLLSPELFIGTYDFETEEPGQVSFKRGALLPIVLKEPSGWWAAHVNGRYGWVPAGFLEPWVPPQSNSGGAGPSPVSYRHGDNATMNVLTRTSPRESPAGQDMANIVPLYAEEDAYDDNAGYLSPDHEYPGGGDPDQNHRHSSEYTEEPTTPGGGELDEENEDPLVTDLVAHFSGSELQGQRTDSSGNSGMLPAYGGTYSPQSSNTSPTSHNHYNSFHSRGLGGSGRGRGHDLYYALTPHYDPPIPHQLSLVLEEGSDVNSQWSMAHSSQAFSHTSSASALEKQALQQRGERQGLSPSGSTNPHSGSLVSPASPLSPGNANGPSTASLHHLLMADPSTPWYLRPKHAWDELKLDADGLVVAGTAPALIERLTMDSTLSAAQEATLRSTLLMTFKTWTTAEQLYESLLGCYTMDQPEGLGPAEALEWKEKKLRPAQMRVLCIFGLWIEKHGLMVDEPGLVPRLRTWLSTILSPTGLALSAKQLVQNIDRIRHADDTAGHISTSPTSAFSLHIGASLRRKTKPPKSDFLKWDAGEVANHLTLVEARAYGKIRPYECLAWTRAGGKVKKEPSAEALASPGGAEGSGGGDARNLIAFIGGSDRLAMWVKNTILSCESLGRRADMIDLWIKIAERCRHLNNIFSMSTIVTALSGGDIGKLHLTWAHVSKASHFEQMVRLTDPTGNFSAYRALHASLAHQPEGANSAGAAASLIAPNRDSFLSSSPSTVSSASPTSSLTLSISSLSAKDGAAGSSGPACVPFLNPFLTELMYIHDQCPNTIQTPPRPEPSQPAPRPLLNVLKLQRQADVVTNMLRFVDRLNVTGTHHHPSCLGVGIGGGGGGGGGVGGGSNGGGGGKGSSPADGYRSLVEKENPAMMAAMEAQMEAAAAEAKKDAGYFWKRSQEIQGMEVLHADIWKNLNDAGF